MYLPYSQLDKSIFRDVRGNLWQDYYIYLENSQHPGMYSAPILLHTSLPVLSLLSA